MKIVYQIFEIFLLVQLFITCNKNSTGYAKSENINDNSKTSYQQNQKYIYTYLDINEDNIIDCIITNKELISGDILGDTMILLINHNGKYDTVLETWNFVSESAQVFDRIEPCNNNEGTFVIHTYFPHANAGRSAHYIQFTGNNKWMLSHSIYKIQKYSHIVNNEQITQEKVYKLSMNDSIHVGNKDYMMIASEICNTEQNIPLDSLRYYLSNGQFKNFPDEFERDTNKCCKQIITIEDE